MLLHELQHCLANSLQITVSVLVPSAALRDAGHRVMSVAAMQKQLVGCTKVDVLPRQYLTELCQSIGASMIQDVKVISLHVTVGDHAKKSLEPDDFEQTRSSCSHVLFYRSCLSVWAKQPKRIMI